MSGHSKWHEIKHKKAKMDAQKGRVFTKVIREVTVAARLGGGDPEGNPRLRDAIDRAKAVNMPQDNITRAIQKGTGELPGVTYEDCIYEGYGPGGGAVLVEATTDNKNRTASELRKLFSKHGGNLGEAGCVAWMFTKQGIIRIEGIKADEEKLLPIVLEAGAEDLRVSDDRDFEIITTPQELSKVRQAIAIQGVEIAAAEITALPQSTVRLEGKEAQQMLRLMEELEEHDDVQNVYANFDIPDEIMAAMS